MSLIKTRFGLERFIISPYKAGAEGPTCDLCNQVVDSETLVEGEPGIENDAGMVIRNAGGETCRVLVKHHGQEEVRTIDMGSRCWGPSELRKWMTRMKWFVPQRDE